MRKEILYRLLNGFGWKRLPRVKQLIFLDESNKYNIKEYHYVSAILITNSESFLDVFRDIVNHHTTNGHKELKFSKMRR